MQQSDDERNENFNQLKPIFGGLRFNDPFGNSQEINNDTTNSNYNHSPNLSTNINNHQNVNFQQKSLIELINPNQDSTLHIFGKPTQRRKTNSRRVNTSTINNNLNTPYNVNMRGKKRRYSENSYSPSPTTTSTTQISTDWSNRVKIAEKNVGKRFSRKINVKNNQLFKREPKFNRKNKPKFFTYPVKGKGPGTGRSSRNLRYRRPKH